MAKREFLMTEDHESLQERLLAPSMGVLLTIEGTCAGLRAKSDHISSHLPPLYGQQLFTENATEPVVGPF
jgi:hypothetical protein